MKIQAKQFNLVYSKMTIDRYCKEVPNFALFFNFAKQEKGMYFAIVNHNKEDLFQIISLSIYEGGCTKEINNRLKKEMYFFATRVCGYVKKVNRKNPVDCKKYYLSKQTRKCDICNKESNHYMYKSLIPGRDVCRICRNRIVRQDKKRNL